MLTRLLGQMVALWAAVNMLLAAALPMKVVQAATSPVRIVAFGDSLTAGYGVGPGKDFASQLQAALTGAGHAVVVANAGVSGDTTGGGRTRLDWAVPEGTDAVILELGANDMLGGLPTDRARANLDAIVKALTSRGIEVLIAGMLASRTLGDSYADAFDRIYPELAQKYGTLLYPFFLTGVALDPKLNQPDGMHPTADGVAVIVKNILPKVEELIGKVRQRRKAALEPTTATRAPGAPKTEAR